ncbi:MAG TPA: hypothetical protein VFN27_12125 [Xanthobacteraceae bacterium]|nr:hypothetical protein [Xanthobacteraceae bacterium]
MVRYSGVDLDHFATCAFAFVLQTRAFGIQLLQPRHYTLRISATFHQRDEVLYSAVDFAKTPRSSAIGLNARSLQSLPLGRIFANSFSDDAVVE